MALKKDLSDKLDRVVDYVKENSRSPKDGWTVLTYRDIARIAGTASGSTVTKRILEELKEHPNIIYAVHPDPKKSKKPLKFRYVSKQEKFDFVDNKKYNELTEKDVTFIKEKLGHSDIRELYDVLAVVNYLKSTEVDGKIEKVSSSDLSDYLLILEPDIDYILTFLQVRDILVDEDGYYALKLSSKKVTEKKEMPENKEKPKNLSTIYDYLEHANEAQRELTEYIETNILPKVQQTETLEEQLEQGHELLQKCLKENAKLQDELKVLQLKHGKLEMHYNNVLTFKEDLLQCVEENLQILLWQINQIALEDSKKSVSVKNNKKYRANLAKQFADAGNEFHESIMGFSRD